MSNLYFGRSISELRRRSQLTQEALLEKFTYYNPDVYRLETGSLLPERSNRDFVRDNIGIDMGEFVTPLFEDVPMEEYGLLDTPILKRVAMYSPEHRFFL